MGGMIRRRRLGVRLGVLSSNHSVKVWKISIEQCNRRLVRVGFVGNCKSIAIS
jgi:hypothetical protein